MLIAHPFKFIPRGKLHGQSKWISIILFASCFFLFSWLSFHQEVVGFESRFYLFIQEMWRNGVHWFPTTYGRVYPDYPVTATFLSYLFARSGLGLSHFSAAIPSTVAAALTVVFCYLIGASQSKAWGFCAALLLLLTPTFLKSAYSIELDMYPTLMTAGCFYFAYKADQTHKAASYRWIYFFLFLGFIFRGPIGLIIPAGVLCSYYVLNKQFKILLIFCCWATGILILSMAILLFMADQAGGVDFMKDVLRMQIFGRITDQKVPSYFYFLNSLSDYAPIFLMTLLTLGGLCYIRMVRSASLPHISFLWQLVAWVGVVLIGMSIPGDKKIRYILPIAPALALLAAYPLVEFGLPNYFVWFRRIVLTLFFFLPGILVLFILGMNDSSVLKFFSWKIVFFLFFMQCFNFIFYFLKNKSLSYLLKIEKFSPHFLKFFLKGSGVREYFYSREAVLIVFMAVASFIVVYGKLVQPYLLHLETSEVFVRQVEAKRANQHAKLGFYNVKPDGLAIKYLVYLDHQEQPLFVHSLEVLKGHHSVFFITYLGYFDAIPAQIKAHLRIIEEGRLGHDKVVVFAVDPKF